MLTSSSQAALPVLAFKPDLPAAAARWQAYYAGEIIDRPIVVALAPRPGYPAPRRLTYEERVYGDIDALIDQALANAEATYWGGDAVPSVCLTTGPDEISVCTGAELRFSPDSPDTNWSVPYVEDWEQALPLRLHTDNWLWQRLLTLYSRAAERMAGKMVLVMPDLHTNMDLLSGIRGPQRLCTDCLEVPELLDAAMDDARAIFRQLWVAMVEAGRMNETGYCIEPGAFYFVDGAATLQCDFSCMISPRMFRRWVLPALEEEAEFAHHAFYHWDGPGALVHTADLLASRGLHTLSYVPGAGRGEHIGYLDLLKAVQAGGKAVQVWGTPEQIMLMHRELKPEKVMYCTATETPAEADRLCEWLVKHT